MSVAIAVRTASDPFEIMVHQPAQLEGEWDALKWEFWLRERDLTPAVRNLAQHGLMYGVIGGKNRFVIAPEHRVLTMEMFDGLLEVLQTEWPQMRVELDFSQPSEDVPMLRKQARRVRAEDRARELILADPVIAPLVARFDAQLVDMDMKEAPTIQQAQAID